MAGQREKPKAICPYNVFRSWGGYREQMHSLISANIYVLKGTEYIAAFHYQRARSRIKSTVKPVTEPV